MKPTLRRRHLMMLAALALAPAAFAQSSNTPLRVILPVSAGSGVDAIVRAAQNALSQATSQPVVIENLPGAGGITGTQAIVKAAPDGNTIGFVSNNHAVNPSVFKNMPYDGLRDLTPISVVGETPFVLVVHPTHVPARTAKELQAFLQSRPGKTNYASSGNGTIIHLAAAMFAEAAKVDSRHIPYKGTGPMITDLIGGQVDWGVVAVPAVLGHLQSGALRAIGVMGRQRIAALPDLPTIAEQGFPEVEVAGWFAAVAPAKLPQHQLQRLHSAIVTAFNDPAVQAAMARQNNLIQPTSPQAARAFMEAEQARYARLVKQAHITLD
ncbi:tripartite tricarboxylate transporter substrate binding protein [Caldimonas manganoxidans]|uniref:tripartite tricarboxylate transporter substrate binding protein n=1 Tax=Caldimonas manganoxidans TaxID=196015 RepID=UPI0003A0E0C3|nr:tripartite tricarboxylate transporter substrate binding protein [Caldimonas manganoxidans]